MEEASGGLIVEMENSGIKYMKVIDRQMKVEEKVRMYKVDILRKSLNLQNG